MRYKRCTNKLARVLPYLPLMKAATDTTKPSRHSKMLTRRADEPFLLPLQDYCLSFTVLLELTGRKKKRHFVVKWEGIHKKRIVNRDK